MDNGNDALRHANLRALSSVYALLLVDGTSYYTWARVNCNYTGGAWLDADDVINQYPTKVAFDA